MQINRRKIQQIVPIVFLILATVAFPPSSSGAAPILNTDKEVYSPGETVKVNFSEAPGIDGDWICIAPAGSPDTEAGDFKNLPKGWSKGFLTFDPPAPGKYEARAYYNYKRKGYVVSGRAAFSVEGGPGWVAAEAPRMERKLDPQNPLEAGQPPGNGVVYLFREPFFLSSSFDAQIKANGKPVMFMQNASYFPFSVAAGDVTFTSGEIRERSSGSRTESMADAKVTIKVEPGCVYYLKVKMVPKPFWSVSLEQVLHEDGAASIETNKLTRLIR